MTRRHLLLVVIFMATVAFTVVGCGETEEGNGADVISEVQRLSTSSTAVNAGAGSTDADATTPSASSATEPPATIAPGAKGMAEVIVDLVVVWSPEDGLSDEERSAIADAQQEVLSLLEGTNFRVIRLFEITPQMALAVDDVGLKRLEASELVAQVSPNALDPATG
jgi:predicted small secreted protein